MKNVPMFQMTARSGRRPLSVSLLGASVFAIVVGVSSAYASPDDDVAAIRAEMEAMKRDYDAKFKELEKRLENAEAAKKASANAGAPPPSVASRPQPAISPGPQPAIASGPQPAVSGPQPAAAPVAVAAGAPQAAPAGGKAPIGQNAYNPGIAVVLNGSYAAYQHDPDTARLPGFEMGDEAGLEPRGLSLGESELALFANVDHRVYGNLIFSLDDQGHVGVEEAYIQTTSLPGGITIKGGKFLSGIGYLNEKHSHDWDFIDAPLPYRAFLGPQIGDMGLQVRWLAPTDFYLEAGGEVLRGDEFPAAGAANKGAGAYAGYVQTGGDIGLSSSWLAKVSYLHTKSIDRETNADIFNGTDDIGIATLVWKWAPDGNPTRRNLIVNGEYFFGKEKGDFNGTPVNLDRKGWYAQAVYQFRPSWRVGLRYARLNPDAVPISLANSEIDGLGLSPDAFSTMLEFDTSEFSRFRLMYTYDNADVRSNNEFIARYTVIFGPHGAHRF